MGRKNKIICGSLQVPEEVWDASKIFNLVPHSSLLLGAFFFFTAIGFPFYYPALGEAGV